MVVARAHRDRTSRASPRTPPCLALALAVALLGCEARLSLGAGCARDSDCAAPLVCGVLARCQEACVTSADCAIGLHCVRDPSFRGATGAPAVCSLEGVECGPGRACPAGLVCLDARCVNECLVADECPDGVCRSGACEPVVRSSDAGVLDAPRPGDAPDLDAPDLGARGLDAPSLDAASADAPSADAASLDASSADAPSADSGEADVGASDVDAGPSATSAGRLRASDGVLRDSFGWAVALSEDGTRALVGAPGVGAAAGDAYVYAWDGTGWIEEAMLAPTGTTASDGFGWAVDLSADGSRAIVGARTDDTSDGQGAGSAQVFVRTGTLWTLEALLSGSTTTRDDFFGSSVSIAPDGATVVVGSPFDDLPSRTDAGSAALFSRSGTTWIQTAILSASDAAATDELGCDVALSGDGTRVLVAARRADVGTSADAGDAYVFFRGAGGWTEEARLVSGAPLANALFGQAVDLSDDGGIAVVGAMADDPGAVIDAGSAWAFERTGTTWSAAIELVRTGGGPMDAFGAGAAVSGDGRALLVGAPFDDTPAGPRQGSAVLFTRGPSGWGAILTLYSPTPDTADRFGNGVALDGTARLALVGAPLDFGISSTRPGEAHVLALSF